MRVAELAASGHLGGAERVVLETVRGLGARGIEMSLLALEPGPLLVAAARAGAAPVEACPLPGPLAALGDAGRSAGSVAFGLIRAAAPLPGYARQFSRVLAAHAPDVVHSHGIKTHVLATLTRGRAPVVWHLHDYVGLRSVSSKLLPRLARRCDLAIAVSHSVADDARRWLPSRLRVEVVHNAVDTDRFTPSGEALDLDAASGLGPAPPGTIRIGLPATFARWKGHETFIRSIAALGRRDVRAYVIGGPVYQTGESQWSLHELRQLAASLGLDGDLGFTGFVDDMPSAYRALDLVVHASTRPEPFGLVIPEAMSCGRAVLATRTGGASELFDDGVQAAGIDVADEPSMTRALHALLADPSRRQALADRARAHVLIRFTRDQFASRLVAALSLVTPAAAAGR
jgi:glycosyltransferase involved in cell wall biosynthesis